MFAQFTFFFFTKKKKKKLLFTLDVICVYAILRMWTICISYFEIIAEIKKVVVIFSFEMFVYHSIILIISIKNKLHCWLYSERTFEIIFYSVFTGVIGGYIVNKRVITFLCFKIIWRYMYIFSAIWCTTLIQFTDNTIPTSTPEISHFNYLMFFFFLEFLAI